MKVRECLEIIWFNTNTLDALSGKATNNLFSNRNIIQQLKYSLDKYALETKALEGIYSFPLSTNIQSVDEPPDILRTTAYKMIVVYIQGRIYCLNIPNLNQVKTQFPYDIQGLPRFAMPFQNELYIYPTSGTSYNTTTLTEKISKTDTTIYVEDTGNFPLKNGRVTIGDEKIKFSYSDTTTFYECSRGIEGTTASIHDRNDLLSENNCQIFYYKKHFEIPIYDKNVIDEDVLNREMEVCDEHMQIITDYTSYKLLSKVDTERAAFYKMDFEEWLDRTKYEVSQGRSKITDMDDIPSPYMWETSNYLGYPL